jgi:hypothetical protein
MRSSNPLVAGVFAITVCIAAQAEPIAVKHIQGPMRRLMVARSEAGKVIANVEFSQAVKGDEVTMRLTYKFIDGSIDDETTTYKEQNTFRLVRNHHIQKGPFFTRPIDFTVDATTNIATSRSEGRNGKVQVESHKIDLPDDLANGFVGTLLLNAPQDRMPFRAGILAPVMGGRLIQILISQEDDRTFDISGHTLKATVFRIHPELGGIVGVIARLIGLQPRDLMVWVAEGEEPAIVRVVGQLGGYGPVVSSELVGTNFEK